MVVKHGDLPWYESVKQSPNKQIQVESQSPCSLKVARMSQEVSKWIVNDGLFHLLINGAY